MRAPRDHNDNTHEERTFRLWNSILLLFCILPIACICGAIWLFAREDKSETEFSFLFIHLHSTSGGVALVGIAIGLTALIVRKILSNQAEFTKVRQQQSAHASRIHDSHLNQNTPSQQMSTAPPDCGYVITNRTVTQRFDTRTTGITTHEIKFTVTRDYLSQYEGRYRERGSKREMSILSPNAGVKLGETVASFRKFYVTFPAVLMKGATDTMIVQHEWEDDQFVDSPESTLTPVRDEREITFVVILPKGASAKDAWGYIRQHPGEYPFIKRDKIIENNGSWFGSPI